ncbi:glycine zipper domain-containing protein [Salidesulfovibrio brasiliensis]|uniref:glycine zipper domain-containing protein n=1 Tax=Salidesulfovibrio brasiliensis TaxID=221711 RepID=UPI0006D05F63|nr:glycine zipper domain-containing protein [Salidesulfovibrio brasiliensis]
MNRFAITTFLIVSLMTATGCANRAQQGAGIGALAGSTIGALTFKDKALGAAVGAGVGMMMGYIVGNEWDKADEQRVQQTLEHTRSDQTNTWTNPDTGNAYSATPTPPYMQDNRLYRDVTIKDEKTGKSIVAKAWRDENGVWHLKQ